MIFVGKLQTSGRDRTKIEATSEVVRSADEALSVIRRGEGTRPSVQHAGFGLSSDQTWVLEEMLYHMLTDIAVCA